MSYGVATLPAGAEQSDTELVGRVREGDDAAFEELFRRYQRRIAAFVGRLVREVGRAEDITQEAFLSALRRLRVTDSEIAFRPWIYEIARNAAIDSYRRTSRAEEVSINAYERLRPSDRGRLVGPGAPDSAVVDKERLAHLRGAFGELSDTHHRILVMRELEGLSYREIGERLELTRPAVESTLFRARRRLEREYEEIDTGRRCEAMGALMTSLAAGMGSAADARRLGRHALHCGPCRRAAREIGLEPLGRVGRFRAAALFPLPLLVRPRAHGQAGSGTHAAGSLTSLSGPGAQATATLAERAVALIATVALAGAGTAMLGGAGLGPFGQEREAPATSPAAVPAVAPPQLGPDPPRVDTPEPSRRPASPPPPHRPSVTPAAPVTPRGPAAQRPAPRPSSPDTADPVRLRQVPAPQDLPAPLPDPGSTEMGLSSLRTQAEQTAFAVVAPAVEALPEPARKAAGIGADGKPRNIPQGPPAWAQSQRRGPASKSRL